MRRNKSRRRGASLVEFAMVAPVLILVLFRLIIGGLGVFRYHQVAGLAREAARYAAVRGLDYARETDRPAATQQSVYDEVVKANATGLDPSRLTCAVTWDRSNAPTQFLPDKTAVGNVVIVTVSYQWLPEAIFGKATLSSTAKVPMSY